MEGRTNKHFEGSCELLRFGSELNCLLAQGAQENLCLMVLFRNIQETDITSERNVQGTDKTLKLRGMYMDGRYK